MFAHNTAPQTNWLPFRLPLPPVPPAESNSNTSFWFAQGGSTMPLGVICCRRRPGGIGGMSSGSVGQLGKSRDCILSRLQGDLQKTGCELRNFTGVINIPSAGRW
jgi:hypothetical protein